MSGAMAPGTEDAFYSQFMEVIAAEQAYLAQADGNKIFNTHGSFDVHPSLHLAPIEKFRSPGNNVPDSVWRSQALRKVNWQSCKNVQDTNEVPQGPFDQAEIMEIAKNYFFPPILHLVQGSVHVQHRASPPHDLYQAPHAKPARGEQQTSASSGLHRTPGGKSACGPNYEQGGCVRAEVPEHTADQDLTPRARRPGEGSASKLRYGKMDSSISAATAPLSTIYEDEDESAALVQEHQSKANVKYRNPYVTSETSSRSNLKSKAKPFNGNVASPEPADWSPRGAYARLFRLRQHDNATFQNLSGENDTYHGIIPESPSCSNLILIGKSFDSALASPEASDWSPSGAYASLYRARQQDSVVYENFSLEKAKNNAYQMADYDDFM